MYKHSFIIRQQNTYQLYSKTRRHLKTNSHKICNKCQVPLPNKHWVSNKHQFLAEMASQSTSLTIHAQQLQVKASQQKKRVIYIQNLVLTYNPLFL